MAETKAPSVKKYVDYANQQVDEQAILDKYNAATLAQFNVQREQNRQNENAFYNQMYNTQKTAMDTIRQSNAAAVSSGASRGVQAANELSAILGLQSESVAQATELAQANRQTAQEETAAVLENVLNAYQQAAQERSQLVSQGIESASVDVQEAANATAAKEAQINQTSTLTAAIENGTASYLNALQQLGLDYSTTPSNEGYASLQAALRALPAGISGKDAINVFDAADWNSALTGEAKAQTVISNYKQICAAYGIDPQGAESLFNALENNAKQGAAQSGKSKVASEANAQISAINAYIQSMYYSKLTGTDTPATPNISKTPPAQSGINGFFAR